jgi:nicotinamide-nucleotide amidase
MTKPVQAELISVGTELLRGEIVDTNAAYLASQLPLLGFDLHRITTAGDILEQLSDIIRQALTRSTVVVTTGGLGPTQDDLTREAIAATLGESMSIDPKLENDLRAMFVRTGREMPPSNIKQAAIIPSAKALPNPRGTAPGWWVEKNGKVIVILPGPPREMTPMWQNEAVPRLKRRFPGKAIMTRTIKTFLLQEAKVAELAQPFFERDDMVVGIYAKPDGIQLRLIATGDDAGRLLDDAEKRLKELLNPYVWGTDDDTLDGMIGKWLSNRGMSLATMEDATGGLLGSIISDSARGRNYYRGGLIATDDENKITMGVSEDLMHQYGTVSAETAEAMAQAARERLDADIGIGITDVVTTKTPSGFPQGTVFIGIADVKGTKTWQQQYIPGRTDTRERAAIACLFRLRERLLELNLAD